MKMDQVAFYAPTPEAEAKIKSWFGLTQAPWIEDRVRAQSIVRTLEGAMLQDINVADLQFNYDLGIELEIIRYDEGSLNWVTSRSPMTFGLMPFVNHIGIHLADGEEFPEMRGATLVQETWTLEHTAKYLVEPSSPGYGRRYHYRIWETQPGSYIKYIRRIHPGNR